MNFGFSLPHKLWQRLETFSEKHEVWLMSLLAVGTLIYAGFYAQFHVDPHHDGIILKPAYDILHDKKLFLDTFTQYGALTTLIHASFMQLFGETLLALRWSAVVAYGLIAVLLYKLWRNFLPAFVTFLTGVIWLITAYFPNQQLMVPFLGWSSVYALLFQLLSIYLVQHYVEKQNRWWLAAAGVSTALTFWVRQPVGIFLAGAVVVFLGWRWLYLKNKARVLLDTTYYLAGLVLASVPFLLWLASFNGVSDWWQQSIVLAFDFGHRLSRSYSATPILQTLIPSLSVSKKNLLWLTTVASTWLLAVVTSIRIMLAPQKTTTKMWLFLLIAGTGLASWLQFFPANDQSHFFWAATPLLGLSIYVTYHAAHFIFRHGSEDLSLKNSQQWSWLPLAATSLFLFIATLPFTVTAIKGGKYYLTHDFTTLQQPSVLHGMKVEAEEAQVLTHIDQKLGVFFNRYPDKKYINVTPDALYGMMRPEALFFHKQHVYWDWATQTIFPDYPEALSSTIAQYRPVILFREPIPSATNYCQVDIAIHKPMRMHTFQRDLFVAVPAEDVLSVQRNQNNLMLQASMEPVSLTSAQVWERSLLTDPQTIEINQSTQLKVATNEVSQPLVLTFLSETFGQCRLSIP